MIVTGLGERFLGHTVRGLFTLLVAVLSVCGVSEAQVLIRPEVEVRFDNLSGQEAARMDGVKERVLYLLQDYRRPEGIDLVPKRPMNVLVQVVFSPEKTADGLFLTDVRFLAYRPKYESEDETIIFSALEEGIPLDPTLLTAPPAGRGELPTEPLLLRVHYFATLALLMYYDSFDLNGGDAYLRAIKANERAYTTPPLARSGEPATGTSLYLNRLPQELETEWGSTFRELWLLFHLEILDSKLRTKGSEETLLFVLREWVKLLETHQVPGLMQLLRDTKAADASALPDLAGKETATKAKASIRSLFPALSSRP